MANKITDQDYDEMLDTETPSSDSVNNELTSEVSKLSAEDDEVDKEVNDSEDLSKLLYEPLPEKESVVKASPEEDTALSKDKRFEDLLSSYQKDKMISNLLRGGAQIGQSMAGRYSGDFKPDNSFSDAMDKQRKEPIDMYKKLLEEKRKAMPKTTGKRFQLSSTVDPKTGNVVQAIFDVTTGEIVPTDKIRGFATQIREDKRTGELLGIQPGSVALQQKVTSPESAPKQTKQAVPLERSLLDNKQNERVDKARDEFLKDTDDARTALGSARNAKALIASGGEINGDIVRGIQNQLARATGEKGAMTDRDVAPFGGRQAILDRLNRWGQVGVFGKLPESDRKFLTQFADLMEKRAGEYVKDRSNYFTKNLHKDLKSSKNLRDVNFDESSVENLIGVGGAVDRRKEDSVLMRSPDGKTARVKKDQVQKYLDKGAVLVNE